jgi:uncharacterized protein
VEPMLKQIRRYPITSYLVLTFVLSWGSVIILADGVPGPQTPDAELSLAIIAMLAGPAAAGPLMIGLVHGRSGMRALGARMRRWRVPTRWYALALLTAPITVFASLLALAPFSREFVPGIFTTADITSLALFALAAALPTALLEELGWTGFATPELRRRHGVLATGLVLGAVWGAWHYPVNVWGSATAAEAVPVALFLLVALFSFLPPYRILMVWVYARTESALLAMLMHASLVTFWLMATPGVAGTPDAIAGWAQAVWYLVWAALLWVVVAVVAAARHRTARQGRSGTVGEPAERRASIGVPISS